MKKRIPPIISVCSLALSTVSQADIPFLKATTLHFASASEGKTVLSAKDDFVRRLSQFDRSARMKTDRPVSEEEFLAFAGKDAVDWSQREVQNLEGIAAKIQSRLGDLSLSFPETILFIKSNGSEEGGAAYTRGSAIVLPESELAKNSAELERIVCHELFHIWSRSHPQTREQLYQMIGFSSCPEIELPPELDSRRITNPDAPRNDHFIRLSIEGRDRLAVPILLSTAATYDVSRGGVFFDYLELKFLVVEKTNDTAQIAPVLENGAPKLVGLQATSGFFEQVGRNTQYIIHPEEILADNFALLILGGASVPSPEILQKMRTILQKRQSTSDYDSKSIRAHICDAAFPLCLYFPSGAPEHNGAPKWFVIRCRQGDPSLVTAPWSNEIQDQRGQAKSM